MISREMTPFRRLKNTLLSPRTVLLMNALPFVIFIFIFSYLPLVGWIMSLYDYKAGVPLSKQEFTGLYYFKIVFDPNSGFYQSLINTLALNFLGLMCSPVALIFAVMINELKGKRFRRIIQTISSLPNFISWILVYVVFFTFFGNQGFVNTILMNIGIIKEPINVLGNDEISWYFQTMVGLWKNVGWGAIIYIASMSGIDTELYDAAAVDGCDRFGNIWHITIPSLLPTYIVLLLLMVSNMLGSNFEQFYVFSNPLVVNKLNVLDIFIYKRGLGMAEYSFATALGIMRSIVSISLLLSVNWIARKIRGNSII